MPDNIYQRQAELLLRILPSVMREDVFALKGGTAINFFWRDYPRLSVDIDLTYLPLNDRDLSLLDISDRLASIEDRFHRIIPDIETTQRKDKKAQLINGLNVRQNEATVKIEVNTVIRGSVYPPVRRKLSEKAENEFELSVSTTTLSFADLYGGKICAALDRQHPRDLFDIKLLLDNEGINDEIRKSFLVYLISHSRPIVELLNPNKNDIEEIWRNEFKGMTVEEIELKDLIHARSTLIRIIKDTLTDKEKEFLISFKGKAPKWNLLELEGIEELPAVRWKLRNINNMSEEKHVLAFNKLEAYLSSF